MDTEELIRKIEENGKLFEVAKVTTYRGYQKNSNREVEVKIYDRGQAAAGQRYRVTAETADKSKGPDKFATGNSGDSLDIVLTTVHWFDLTD